MNKRVLLSLINKAIVGLVLFLYVLFLYMDFYNAKISINSKYIKYMCILLCFLLSILTNRKQIVEKGKGTIVYNNRDIYLLQLAMFLTVIADLFLVILDSYILGIVCFCLVQITYSIRYTIKKSKMTLLKKNMIFQCVVIIYVLINFLIIKINILLPISLFYSICLINAFSKAIMLWKSNLYPCPSKYFIVFGMILFLLCDICVGLSNIYILLDITGYFFIKLQQTTWFLIWVFYIPSQLLLSLSGSEGIPMPLSHKLSEEHLLN
jgi:hypothetical protein